MKRTIFEGTVNGERFDNIQEYNARVKELMESGKFESASSSTRVEEYDSNVCTRTVVDDSHCDCGCDCGCDCTCNCDEQFSLDDDELSFYPYLEDDDPHYLDLLVTDHHNTNREALAEVLRVFEKCKRYIIDALEDPTLNIETKKNYLEDIKEIVEDLTDDKKDTLKAIKKLEKKAEYLKKEYEEKFLKIDKERFILEESRPVIDAFLDFYRGIECDVILNIKESTNKPKSVFQNKKKITDVNVDNHIDTDIKVSHPQTVTDLQDILERVFGPFRNVK